MKQFLKNLKEQAKRGGDVNVANVGEGAQVDQLAVGRNILQAKINIGSIVVPVRFLLALLGVAALIALIVWWYAVPWQMPAGSSVAVVDFAERTPSGSLSLSNFGRRYADYMAGRMAAEADAFPIKPSPVVWHITAGLDPVAAFFKRLILAPIPDEQSAQELANRFGAAVVVYGFVERNGDGIRLTPQFSVKQAKGEADELSDPQQLGASITLSQTNEERLNTYLYPLGRAMLWLTKGLWTGLEGDFIQSYLIFKQAEEELRPETVWPRALGKEVLYGFLGDSALFLSGCETDARQVFTSPDSSAVEQALDASEAAFNQARLIGEEQGRPYARAYFGLAQVAFQRAQRVLFPPEVNTAGQCRIPETSSPTPGQPYTPQFACPAPLPPPNANAIERARALLDESLRLLDLALSTPHPTDTSRLDERMRAVRANVEVTVAAFDLQLGNPTAAEPRLTAQIELLESLLKQVDPEDKRTLSETNWVLGTAYNYLANARAAQGSSAAVKPALEQARAALNTCVEIIGDPRFQTDRFKRLSVQPNCYCAREGVQKTLEQLP